MQAHQFHELLRKLDSMQAAQTQAEGCVECASKLDRANYRRKVRGVGRGDEAAYELRDSFCCRKEGCRTRATPPSVRFLGRRVDAAVVVVLLTALQHGVLPGMRKRGKTVKSATGQLGLRGMRCHRSLRHEAWPVARRGGDEMEPR